MVGYDGVVEEARACVDEVEAKGWRLAELCWQAKHEHGKSYAQFARDVGGRLTRSGVHHYAQVWADRDEEEHGSFADAFAHEISSAAGRVELEEYAAERGIKPSSARTELAFSRRAVEKGPAPLAAELARAALARPEVREKLAESGGDDLHTASVDVAAREDRRAGHDRTRAVQPSPRPEHDRTMAEMEIMVSLHKLFQLAQRHGLEEFLVEKLDETRDRLQMAIEAGSPEKAVAELERWLAGQS
jgi:hypothetical protein